MAMCHPVAITGSTYLHTHRTITVPTAMLCAARSIHHSPLSHNPPSAAFETAAIADCASPLASCASASRGSSSMSKPTTPRPSPATPAGASVSP